MRVMIVCMNASPLSPDGQYYPAEMGDQHLSILIQDLDKKVDRGFRDVENDIKDLRNEIRDNVSKETFQSEVKRVDENRINDTRHNETKFANLELMIDTTNKAIDGMKSFTWKAVTASTAVVGLVFTGVNMFL